MQNYISGIVCHSLLFSNLHSLMMKLHLFTYLSRTDSLYLHLIKTHYRENYSNNTIHSAVIYGRGALFMRHRNLI